MSIINRLAPLIALVISVTAACVCPTPPRYPPATNLYVAEGSDPAGGGAPLTLAVGAGGELSDVDGHFIPDDTALRTVLDSFVTTTSTAAVVDLHLGGDEARITAAELGIAVARVRNALAASPHAKARAAIIQIHASALTR